MKKHLTRIAICVGLLMVASVALALDNTVSNEFWCTWGYVNPSPSLEPSCAIENFDSSVLARVKSAVMEFFSSIPSGIVLLVR